MERPLRSAPRRALFSVIVLVCCGLLSATASVELAQDEDPDAAQRSSIEDRLAEMEAARARTDLPAARALAASIVEELLAASEPQRDDAWTRNLDRAALGAWGAEDPRTAHRAWTVVLERRTSELGGEDPVVLRLLQSRAGAQMRLGETAAAKAAYERVLELRLRVLPDHDDLVLSARVGLAGALSELGDLRGARELYERVLEARERHPEGRNPTLLSARLNFARNLVQLAEYQAALPIYEALLEQAEGTLAEGDMTLLRIRTGLAGTLSRLGHSERATELNLKVLEIATRTLPEDHDDLQVARINVALDMKRVGEMQAARELEEQVLAIRTRRFPADHSSVLRTRTNLAATLRNLGDLAGARVHLEAVLEARERILPPDHPDRIFSQTMLAGTLFQLGEYQAARELFESAAEMLARTQPEDHPDLLNARRGLAGVALRLGDLPAARAGFERELEIRSRSLPDDHPDLQKVRLNLGAVLDAVHDSAGARALLVRAFEVMERTLPEDDGDLQLVRMNLANSEFALGNFQRARELQETLLEIYERSLTDEHPNLQLACLNLSATLLNLGEPEAAEALSARALAARVQSLGEGHALVQDARASLICATVFRAAAERAAPWAASATGDERRTRLVELVRELSRGQAAQVDEALRTLPSREVEERCAYLSRHLDHTLSACLGYGVFERCSELDADVFRHSEVTRHGGLAAGVPRVLARDAPELAAARERLRAASEELAREARAGSGSSAFREALQKREACERDWLARARSSAELPDSTRELDAASVAGALGADSAAVAFRRYTRRSVYAQVPGKPGVEPVVDSLMAFVVRGVSAEVAAPPAALPVFVDLGPLAPIEAAVGRWRAGLDVGAGRGVGALGGASLGEHAAAGAALRALLIEPLRAAWGDARRVLFVLDDVLHLVPFDALPHGEAPGVLLGDVLRVETRATLRELLDPPPPPSAASALLAVGGVDYDRTRADDLLALAGGDSSVAAGADGDVFLRGQAFEHGFAPLPGTSAELAGLAELFALVARRDESATLLRGVDASRAGLVQAVPTARWLHIATHGWYASDSIRSWSDPEPLDAFSGLGVRPSGAEQVREMSPLLLCGLALAGANRSDERTSSSAGLLTADELSTIDLSNCELVVLSACDTNVGERRAGQGVASLQKALQMAGARSVITSLWKVPDEATKELMLDFYRRMWIEKKPKWQALWEAKTKLRETKDERGAPKYSTRDWAAWVLTGDPD
jgi:CHAT domain-containing protein/tetratricopeptide (TPR) repeat protein